MMQHTLTRPMTSEEQKFLQSQLVEKKPLWKYSETYILALVFTGVYWLTSNPPWYYTILAFLLWVGLITLLRYLGNWIENRPVKQDLANKKVLEVSGLLEQDETKLKHRHQNNARWRVLNVVIDGERSAKSGLVDSFSVGDLVTVEVAPDSGFVFGAKPFVKPKKR